MDYTVKVTTQPVSEPVTLTEAKKHLRIDHDDEDALITIWIKAAREYAETHCARRFVTQTVQVKLSSWPADGEIRLESFGPGDITAITAITYLDVDGVSQTIASGDYQSSFDSSPPVIWIAPDVEDWPDVEEDRLFPITITLTVGADPLLVPAQVKAAMMLAMTYWNENRGGEGGESPENRGMPAGALRLLQSMWTGAYG